MSFTCLYHRQPSDKVSKEDIMLRALGCKKVSSTLICPDCNNDLGSDVDGPFADSISLITTLVNPKHRRRAAPTQNMTNTAGKEFEIHPGGEARVPKKKIGTLSWQGSPHDLEDLEKMAKQIADGKGLDINNLNVQRQQTEVGTFLAEFKIPVDKAFRSACKSAFELLALNEFTDDDRSSDLLLEVRNYIKKGGNYADVGWMVASIRGDAPFMGCRHSLLLVQCEDLSIYWEYVIYGGIIAISGRFPSIDKKIDNWLYQVEPLSGTSSEMEGRPPFDVPGDMRSWTSDNRVGIGRLQAKMPQLNQFVNIRLMLGKYIEPLLTKVWTDTNEFNQTVGKMTQDYVRETALKSGKTEMDVMMEMAKLFSNGI